MGYGSRPVGHRNRTYAEANRERGGGEAKAAGAARRSGTSTRPGTATRSGTTRAAPHRPTTRISRASPRSQTANSSWATPRSAGAGRRSGRARASGSSRKRRGESARARAASVPCSSTCGPPSCASRASAHRGTWTSDCRSRCASRRSRSTPIRTRRLRARRPGLFGVTRRDGLLDGVDEPPHAAATCKLLPNCLVRGAACRSTVLMSTLAVAIAPLALTASSTFR